MARKHKKTPSKTGKKHQPLPRPEGYLHVASKLLKTPSKAQISTSHCRVPRDTCMWLSTQRRMDTMGCSLSFMQPGILFISSESHILWTAELTCKHTCCGPRSYKSCSIAVAALPIRAVASHVSSCCRSCKEAKSRQCTITTIARLCQDDVCCKKTTNEHIGTDMADQSPVRAAPILPPSGLLL